MAGKRKGAGTGTGRKDTRNNTRPAVAEKKSSGSAVPITPNQERNTNKEHERILSSSPGRRGATGVALEDASSPMKENTMNGATTTSNSSFHQRRSSSSSSSSSSSDDESSDTDERNGRTIDKVRDNEQKENETGTATHEEMYKIAQGNMGAIKNDKREGSKAFDVARDLVYSWMKFLDEDQYNSSNGIVASFISDQLNLFPEETPSMSNVVKENLRMGKNAWWFNVNGFVRDAINNSRAYACAKLRKGLRRK
jgi:hypothetical protein